MTVVKGVSGGAPGSRKVSCSRRNHIVNRSPRSCVDPRPILDQVLTGSGAVRGSGGDRRPNGWYLGPTKYTLTSQEDRSGPLPLFHSFPVVDSYPYPPVLPFPCRHRRGREVWFPLPLGPGLPFLGE